MTAYIARDGAEIGSFSREEIERMAGTGELLPTDYYWHEGMENWLFLGEVLATENAASDSREEEGEWSDPVEPAATVVDAFHDEAPAPSAPFAWPRFSRKHLRIAVATVAGLLVLGIVIQSLRAGRRRSEREATTLFSPAASAAPVTAADELALRDKAAAELKQKIERLPARAKPPLSTFYYDVSVNMRRSVSRQRPWSATIRGRENVLDAATGQTLRRTEFILTSDYRDGEWTFAHYHGVTTDLADASEKEEEHDEDTPTPPSLVGMLGLKRKSD